MAKRPAKGGQEADLAKLRKELERKQAVLQKLQEKLRGNAYDAKTREKVQSAKAEIVPLIDQEADLQRAISKAAGGRQLMVE